MCIAGHPLRGRWGPSIAESLVTDMPSCGGGGSPEFLSDHTGSCPSSDEFEANISPVPDEQMQTLPRCDANRTRCEGG